MTFPTSYGWFMYFAGMFAQYIIGKYIWNKK